jgi:hypothetical protein
MYVRGYLQGNENGRVVTIVVRPSCFAPILSRPRYILALKKSRPRYILAHKVSFAMELTG